MNHLSLVPVPSLTPVLRVLKWCLHLLMAGLLALAVGRAVLDGAPHPAGIVIAAAVLGAVYAAGPLTPAVGRARPATVAWLSGLGIAWLALLALTPDGLWIAFPFYFLLLHLLPPRAGLVSVAATALVGAAGYTAHMGSFSVAVFVGPVLGAAFAVATVFGYQALYRESEERRQLIHELTTARADLEAVGRRAGMMAERERLAREIHDTLAQGLSSIQLLLSAAERSLGPAPGGTPTAPAERPAEGEATPGTRVSTGTDTGSTSTSTDPTAGATSGPSTGIEPSAEATASAARYVALARKAAQDNLAEARRFVHALVPPDLEGEGASLHVALERLCDTTTVRHGLSVHFQVSGTPSPFPAPYEVAVLRIAQSALANAVAHSGAGSVEVTLSYMDKELALDVVDDGAGFEPDAVAPPEPGRGGFGLAAMRARARALGGALSVESTPGHGTAIALQLPVSYAESMNFPASLGYRP